MAGHALIRRVFDDTTDTSRRLLTQAQDILRKQFHLLSEAEINKLAEQLRDPLKHRFIRSPHDVIRIKIKDEISPQPFFVAHCRSLRSPVICC